MNKVTYIYRHSAKRSLTAAIVFDDSGNILDEFFGNSYYWWG